MTVSQHIASPPSLPLSTTNLEYRAQRRVDPNSIEGLVNLGPAIVLRITVSKLHGLTQCHLSVVWCTLTLQVSNSLSREKGTTIPESRLLVYLPVNTSLPETSETIPLLLLDSVTGPTDSLCHHFNVYQNYSVI